MTPLETVMIEPEKSLTFVSYTVIHYVTGQTDSIYMVA